MNTYCRITYLFTLLRARGLHQVLYLFLPCPLEKFFTCVHTYKHKDFVNELNEFFQNPKVCTNLSDEIKLFHTIASTDLEDYLEEFNMIKEEVLLRVPFCQLSNDEENNFEMIHGSGLFELKELRFDRLIQASQNQIYFDPEKRVGALGKLIVKQKRTIPCPQEGQGFDGVESSEQEKSQSREIISNFDSISSCDSNDVAETGIACGAIAREKFIDKESYIEAWAENQAMINLPCEDSLQIDSLVTDSIGNFHDENGLTQASFDTFPLAWSHESLTGLSSKRSYDGSFCIMQKEEPLEFEDELTMGKKISNMNVPVEEEYLQGKSERCQDTNVYVINRSEEGNPHSMNIDLSKDDITFNSEIIRSSEPEVEGTSIPKELVKISKENVIYIKKGRVENTELPVNLGCRKIKLEESCSESEPSVLSPLKITLVRVGCYNWTVKQDDVNCDRELGRGGTVRKANLHELDEKAIERMEVLNRVKQVLAHEKSSKTIKLKSTRRFKALKQKAATLYSMKSQIIGRKQG